MSGTILMVFLLGLQIDGSEIIIAYFSTKFMLLVDVIVSIPFAA